MNILDEIVEHKKKEVKDSKMQKSISQLESQPAFNRTAYSLKSFLLDENKTGIIAEFKRRSPSKGVINDWSHVNDVTGSYARNYASGISVLTDGKFFGGSLKDLEAARENELPLLRKDFIIDEYQVIEAKAYGADVILLIAACLSKQKTKQLAALAKRTGLEVLLEVHDETELEWYYHEVDMIGVNNRNLGNFKVDIQTSFNLADKIPSSVLPVAESGISDVETIVSLKKVGFKGFLIGENFMKHTDPAVAFAAFVQQLKANT
jgi:indole-3-glycerol phosphate synthase